MRVYQFGLGFAIRWNFDTIDFQAHEEFTNKVIQTRLQKVTHESCQTAMIWVNALFVFLYLFLYDKYNYTSKRHGKQVEVFVILYVFTMVRVLSTSIKIGGVGAMALAQLMVSDLL